MDIQSAELDRRMDAIEVNFDHVRSTHWSHEARYMYTKFPNGSTAIAIVSDRACILAHIFPFDPDHDALGRIAREPRIPADEHIRSLMQQVVGQYDEEKQREHFPESTTSIVLAAHQNGTAALPKQVEFARVVLAGLGLPVTLQGAESQREGLASGDTCLVVHARAGTHPHLYVNRQMQVFRTHRLPANDMRAQRLQAVATDYGRAILYNTEPQALQMMAAVWMQRHRVNRHTAESKVRILLSISYYQSLGYPLADAINQFVANCVNNGEAWEEASRRVGEALGRPRRAELASIRWTSGRMDLDVSVSRVAHKADAKEKADNDMTT